MTDENETQHTPTNPPLKKKYDPWEEYRMAKKARDEEAAVYDALSPAELAQSLRKNCEIPDDSDLDDVKDRLMKQALLLDSSFNTVLHQSGLGRGASLELDTFKVAMSAQQLYRQAYDSLKDEKQTREGHKDE